MIRMGCLAAIGCGRMAGRGNRIYRTRDWKSVSSLANCLR